MCLDNVRALHFVLKISNRLKSIEFYRDLLQMKCLRHEEFTEGCKATCNGPYNGKWSKTIIGYGDEDDNFVLELTYNYGIRHYEMGNDFNFIEISSKQLFKNIKMSSRCVYEHVSDDSIRIKDPNGYHFVIRDIGLQAKITKVSLMSSNLNKTKDYWCDALGMRVLPSSSLTEIEFAYSNEFKLEFVLSKESQIDHKTSNGRLAFSCKTIDLARTQEKLKQLGFKILTPLVTLDTPGKETVSVVILSDVDEHEICFVGDEGFRLLSKVDLNANNLLNASINADQSDDWHAKQSSLNK